MEMTGRTLRSRLISLLLAVCIAAGFVPLIDYSVFAADSSATIGELTDGVSAGGNGWSWDGSGKLSLFGTELKSGDDGTPKIAYSGSLLRIEVSGYNRAAGNSLLAECAGVVRISGSGILDCDSMAALLDCQKAAFDGCLIKAPDAALFKDSGKETELEFLDGYLEIGTVNAVGAQMQSGVISCGVLQLDGDYQSRFEMKGGVMYAEKASVVDQNQACTISCQGSSILRVKATEAAVPDDFLIQQSDPSIVMVGGSNAKVKSTDNNSAHYDNGINVYCKAVSGVDTITDTESTAGVYYTNSNVFVNDNATLSGAVYFKGDVCGAYGNTTGFTIASGATVAGGSCYMETPVSVEENAIVYFDEARFANSSIKGSIYCGSGKVQFTNSTLDKGSSLYSLGYSKFENSTINGSAAIYCTSSSKAASLNKAEINGIVTIYDSKGSNRKNTLELLGDPSSFGENAWFWCYAPDNRQMCYDPEDFDMTVGSKAFYSAADLGEEYKATVSCESYNCGKAICIGSDSGGIFEKRFDTAFQDSGRTYSGHDWIYHQNSLSLDPADTGDKVLLAYNCTRDIDLDKVAVTITKDGVGCTSSFKVTPSHYYTNDSNALGRSLGIEISAKERLAVGDKYDVTIGYDGMTAAETIEVTGVYTSLNFTGKNDCAPAVWRYDGVEFTDANADYAGESGTWSWYANGNTELGYPAKTLVLNGIDFASSKANAVIVPGGTTIILKGQNRLYSATSAIRANGDLTIKGEDGGSLTAISNELSPCSHPEYYFDAVIKAYANDYDSKTIIIKDAKLDLTAKKAADASGSASNSRDANCYCISGKRVIIDNSDITARSGRAGSDSLKSACVAADEDITLKGRTRLDLTSEELALYPGQSIKSVGLDRLEGADVSLEDFNRSLAENSGVYQNSIGGTTVYLTTKPLEQKKEVKTADILDPEDGVQTIQLSDYFSGGTNSYIFGLADGVTLPGWITLAQDGTLTLKVPNVDYAGEVYKLTAADEDIDLRSDPVVFDLTVGKIGRTVNLTVDYDAALGTVTPKTGKVLAGEDTVITIEAKDGMYVDSVTIDGAPAELSASEKTSAGRIISGTYTIESISADHTVSVVFKEIPVYNVTISQSGNGTITPETAALPGSPNFTYREGTDVVISAVAADGSRIKSVTLDGADVKLTDGRYTIKCITANCTFAVEFEEIPKYQLTVNASGNGTVTVDTAALPGLPDFTFYEGADVTVTITAGDDNYVSAVRLNGTDVELTTVNKNADGRIIGGTYAIKGISAESTLEVVFQEIPKRRLAVNTSGNGTVTVDTAALPGLPDYTFYEGADVTVTITAGDDNYVSAVRLNGTDVELTTANKNADGRIIGGTYVVKGISAESALEVIFEEIPKCRLTVNASGNGTVTVDTAALPGLPDFTFYEGADVTVIITAGDDNYVSAVRLNGTDVELTTVNKNADGRIIGGTYAIKGISAESALEVVFQEIPKYQLTVNASGNGTVTVDTAALPGLPDYTFYEGTEVSVTITPGAGYSIKTVKLGGASVSVNNGKLVFSIGGDCALEVEFEKKYSGGSYSGGSSGRPSGRPASSTELKPTLNGTEMSWNEIAAELDKMTSGGSVTISMNGTSTVPAGVVKSIINKKLKAEFIVDSARSWIIDGENVASACDADLRVINRISDNSRLRGECAADVKVNKSEVPAALRLKLNKEHAGKFANIYRVSNGKPEYFRSVKIGADGTVAIIGAEAGGEYVAMVYSFSDLPGDADNNGILNAFDASAILKYAVGLGAVANPEMADMNGDGAINALDAREILKAIIGA